MADIMAVNSSCQSSPNLLGNDLCPVPGGIRARVQI